MPDPRRAAAHLEGVAAETLAAGWLERRGWQILRRRWRSGAGEIDLLANDHGVLVIVEVKRRRHLADAAYALRPNQAARLLAAAEVAMAAFSDLARNGVRFDAVLVDGRQTLRHVPDILREGMG